MNARRSPYDPGGYTYPLRSAPLTRKQLEFVLASLLLEGGVEPRRATVTYLPELDDEHWRNPRRYAQVGTQDLAFEFTHAILWLPDAQLMGVLAHEVGHVLAPEGGEDDADLAATEILGIPIGYDLRWPGKGLQTATSLL